MRAMGVVTPLTLHSSPSRVNDVLCRAPWRFHSPSRAHTLGDMEIPSLLRTSLAALLTLAPGCASSTAPGSTCPEPAASGAPMLRGTYVITRISGADGRMLTADEMHRNLGVEGSRLALTFEAGNVGVELILIAEVDAQVSATASHRFFVASTCSASMAAVWSSSGFVLPSDLRAVGTASAILVDRSVEDDGSRTTHTESERARCSASLDADTFTIVEQGAPNEDGRTSTVVLRYGENQGSMMELEATLSLEELDLVDFAVETAADEDAASAAPN